MEDAIAPAGLTCWFGPDGGIVRTSERDRAVFPAGAVVFDIVVPADRERLLAAAARKELDEQFDLRCKDSTGRLRVFAARLEADGDAQFRLSARDVTETRRLADIIDAQRVLLDQVSNGSPVERSLDAIARLVERGTVDAVVAIYVRRDDRLDLAAAPSAPVAITHAAATFEAGVVVPPPGAIEPLSGAITAIASDAGFAFGWCCAVVAADGTDRARIVLLATSKRFLSEDERTRCDEAVSLVALALDAAASVRRADDADTFDALTGVLNRTAIVRRLEPTGATRVLALAADLVAISIRVDGVADANRRLGFDSGDAVLVAVAERLRGVVRGRDLLARWSGARFVVVGRNRGGSSALAAFVARLDAGIGAPVRVGSETVEAAPDIRAVTRRPGESITGLLTRLDLAHAGRARGDVPGPAPRDQAAVALGQIRGSGSGTDGR
jgi:diguanylate cyclase (GGDEF)-like protein